ncbi:MAG: hypothetical protein J07AB43_02110 [Candidatus Nanosalina sp. J07AB43]|jgi:hypothetical protein|nr:MAG: hypothetical protein J07AB43_02110 [Candidatus Nanosalina sp. J07AB43]
MPVYVLTLDGSKRSLYCVMAGDEVEAKYEVVNSENIGLHNKNRLEVHGTLDELKNKTEDSEDQVHRTIL